MQRSSIKKYLFELDIYYGFSFTTEGFDFEEDDCYFWGESHIVLNLFLVVIFVLSGFEMSHGFSSLMLRLLLRLQYFLIWVREQGLWQQSSTIPRTCRWKCTNSGWGWKDGIIWVMAWKTDGFSKWLDWLLYGYRKEFCLLLFLDWNRVLDEEWDADDGRRREWERYSWDSEMSSTSKSLLSIITGSSDIISMKEWGCWVPPLLK